MNQIVIRGARQHNLKNIDLVLPRDRLVVITGVSGSGKSSLAFDTLFAEGHRRYVEALSDHARHFLHRLDPSQVEEIQGLSPAIAIEQKGLPRNPRLTVGTLTEIYDHLRLLYVRLGMAYCPSCNKPIRAYTIPQMVAEVLQQWEEGSRLLVLSPLGVVKERVLQKTFKKLRIEGFARVRLDGIVFELDFTTPIPRRPSYKMEIVVDRLVLSAKMGQRLSESLELAAKMGNGTAGIADLEKREKYFSESFRCGSCGRVMSGLTPSLFSFHHPLGMCGVCKGIGTVRAQLPASADWVVGFEGDDDRNSFDSFADGAPCGGCGGSRLNEVARSVRLGGLGIHEVSRLPVPALREWLLMLELSQTEDQISARPRQEILHRLDHMERLGLGYVTLDRSASTLSGGEAQRIRLARQIGTPLSGVLYVFDEPSVGLHPHDHQRLLDILFEIRDSGNTVIVVEHDKETILQADYVVDMGPGAGMQGGEVLFAGTPSELLLHGESLTAQYLSGRKSIRSHGRKKPFFQGALRLVGARGHNLKGITVDFPLGCMTSVTGLSGSGKSTLVLLTLYRELARRLHGSSSPPAPFDRLENAERIDRIILIDQTPIGKTPRSTPATYTGIFASLRELFSQLPEAKARGYGASRFSFNAKGGRCESCKGEGLQRIEMFYLPDVYIECPVCLGARYTSETLEILFKGHSIADVLQMTIHEAAVVFENLPTIRGKLETLIEVGMGYVRLGQPATTLSGGEAQRVKLAAQLSRKSALKTLYILDEPTTGLHHDDILKLLHVLQRLVDLGHTVIMIEHHTDVIKTTDYVIDLGPGAGEDGGYLIATGSPEEVAAVESSLTGRYLKRALM